MEACTKTGFLQKAGKHQFQVSSYLLLTVM